MNELAARASIRTVSIIAALTLAVITWSMPAFAESGNQLYAGNAEKTISNQASASIGLTVQSSKSSYWVKTKDYRFKIPKYWRGKVQWKTTSLESQNKWGNRVRHCRTDIYLKGHKGDKRFLLASTMSGAITGFGSGFDPVITKKMKLQDQYATNVVVLLSKNIPYFIWYAQNDSNWPYYLPAQVKDQKKLLKLATFNKVAYAKAKRNADYGTSAYNAVKKYQKKNFKAAFKSLR